MTPRTFERGTCQTCGGSLEFRRRSEPAANGHHRSVMYCPDCDKEVLRG